MKTRCQWCSEDPLYIDYHDKEWGVPVHDDQLLFEFLILEGAQAGLSWITVLKKRDNYRAAFDNFDIQKVANYNDDDIARLMANVGIVRNQLKIKSAIKNAQGVLKIINEFGSFDAYIWAFVDGKTIQNNWQSLADLPAQTELSQQMSKELKKRGFNFVGPTICYAFMQATGMLNDHTTDCFRYDEVQTLNR